MECCSWSGCSIHHAVRPSVGPHVRRRPGASGGLGREVSPQQQNQSGTCEVGCSNHFRVNGVDFFITVIQDHTMAASNAAHHHVLVVGGSGFLGSAITKRLLSQGHTVTSMSPSGRPFLTPSGHRPAWSSSKSIRWAKAEAFTPSTYRQILTGEDAHPIASTTASSSSSSSSAAAPTPVTAIVSTIGVLLEANYKGAQGSWEEVGRALMRGWGLERPNPLDSTKEGMYEKMNRDAVLSIAETYLAILKSNPMHIPTPSPFVFISAEDIFRPIIDSRYLSTKRQAEHALETMSWSSAPPPTSPTSSPTSDQDVIPDADGAGLESEINTNNHSSHRKRLLRPTYLRPGLMYHPHTRPLSTLPSAFFDLSSTVHASLPAFLPTPAKILDTLGQDSLARLLRHSPLHIDTVAKAASEAISRSDVSGPVGIEGIKRLAGFKAGSSEDHLQHSSSPLQPSPPPPTAKEPWPTQHLGR